MAGIKNEALSTHLALNASKFLTYEALRAELRAISSAKRKRAVGGTAGAGSSVMPMEVDAVTMGGKPKGCGKGERRQRQIEGRQRWQGRKVT